jgi:hypothetical protein
MAGKEHSAYQKKAISNYYDNIDNIMLTKLQEMVTDLYLADSKAKADRLWDRVEKAMGKLKIKPNMIQHIMSKRSVTILAKNVEDWLKNKR